MTRVLAVFLASAFPAALAAQDTDPNFSKAREILVTAHADKNPDTRRDVAAAIGLIGAREKVVAGLDDMLADSDYKVRLAAIGAMADLNDKSVIPWLEKALHDDVAEVAFSAAKVLWRMQQPSGREFLMAVYNKDEKGSSNILSSTFRNTKRQFSTPKTAMLFGLRQGIGFVPVPGLGEGFSAAESLLNDPNFSTRGTALLLLTSEKTAEMEKTIRDALDDHDWSVRAVALQTIALRGRPDDRKLIAPLLDDKKPKVRFRAAAAYLRLALIAGDQAVETSVKTTP